LKLDSLDLGSPSETEIPERKQIPTRTRKMCRGDSKWIKLPRQVLCSESGCTERLAGVEPQCRKGKERPLNWPSIFCSRNCLRLLYFIGGLFVCCHTSMFPGASSALTLYMTGLSLEALLSNTQANENGPGHWKADYSTCHLGTSPI